MKDSVYYLGGLSVTSTPLWGIVYLTKDYGNSNFLAILANILEHGDQSDYKTAIATFQKLLGVIKGEIASRLQLPFNTYLRNSEKLSIEERRQIVSDINRDLSLLNLAVELPGTNGPSKLAVNVHPRNPQGSFQLQGTRTALSQKSTWSAKSLASHQPLRLIIDPPRIESFARKPSSDLQRLP